MRQLHRLEHAVDDQRGADAGAEAEEQHAAAVVAAERLHRRVVDHADRTSERAREVEADPAAAEIHRLGHRLSVHDDAGISNRDDVELPVLDGGEHALHHLRRREVGSRRDLQRSSAAGCQQLHVGAANVDDQNPHWRAL